MRIYIGNLWQQTTESDLQEAFEAYGEVTSVTIIKDKFSGESRGFGFVEMPSETEGQAAIAGLNGSQLGGRTLTVNVARPREERPAGPRGGGDRGPRGDKRDFQRDFRKDNRRDSDRDRRRR
ncbi:MAG: RNA-binding protein [Chloroflexi bacterium]|nr:RNA-binding protein [Chloroflexota bacterium]MCI0580215.1 RNA-binding protein [Chloroflexota bacterium]MCI0646934.1 RNA-binding protein [Chloroflexota bacterium]MCI0728689.1 RNA-binding protein [Chloroflexota bacterium]